MCSTSSPETDNFSSISWAVAGIGSTILSQLTDIFMGTAKLNNAVIKLDICLLFIYFDLWIEETVNDIDIEREVVLAVKVALVLGKYGLKSIECLIETFNWWLFYF